MKLKYTLFSLALASMSTAYAQTTLLSAKAYLDVKSGKLIDNPTLLIENKKIVRVSTQGQLRPPKGAIVINIPNKVLVPGLMDMHVHLTSDATDNFLASRFAWFV